MSRKRIVIFLALVLLLIAFGELLEWHHNNIRQHRFLLERQRRISAHEGGTDISFDSYDNVTIGAIRSATTDASGGNRDLTLGDAKLRWSMASEAKQISYLCFRGPGGRIWQFDITGKTNIEEFDHMRLNARFVTMSSPDSDGQAITVKAGQIILARTLDAPRTIYIIKMGKLEETYETVSVQYAIVSSPTTQSADAVTPAK